MQVSVCVLVLLFYCDVMYVSGLNSFYMDESAYLFLLLSAVFYLRAIRWRRPADAAGLVVSTVLMTAAKTQHTMLAFWIAIRQTAVARQDPLARGHRHSSSSGGASHDDQSRAMGLCRRGGL